VAHPLDGVRAKIVRAEYHLKSFDRERREWGDSSPYAIVSRYDADKSQWTFRVYREPLREQADSNAFGLIIGDYVHSLRSALDHLVWALVTVANKRTVGKEDERRIAFPIITGHPREFWSNKPTIDHLTTEQGLMLEQFQPYRAIGNEKTTALAHLHALWNLDKHKLITPIKVTLAKTESPVFSASDARIIGEPEWDAEVALVDGTDIAWVTAEVIGGEPKVDMDRFSVDVTFGEAGWEIHNLPVLRDITREIVENCNHFFK
jgi:hypothetical protein